MRALRLGGELLQLIEEIIRKERFNVNEMAPIGDKNTDIEAGRKLGLTTYLVLTGYGREHQGVTMLII